jgi:hypothetical protein
MNETETTPVVEAPVVAEPTVPEVPAVPTPEVVTVNEVATPPVNDGPVVAAEVPAPVAETVATTVVDAPPVSKPRKRKAKGKVKRQVKRSGPGRPPVYDGRQRRTIASVLKRHGLTKGIKALRKEKKLKVSLTTANSVAKEFGLTFRRGRPAA